jgi:hypothetical protein
VRTNVTADLLDSSSVARAYKDLSNAERAFRSLKTVEPADRSARGRRLLARARIVAREPFSREKRWNKGVRLR